MVLLSAINYKGIGDGPDIEFVLAQGTPNDWSILLDKQKGQDDESKLKSKWKLLLNELGIQGCDDYEILVIEFLQSGLFDDRDVSAIIDRYEAETDAMDARNEATEFFQRLIWDHRLTDTDLLEQAKALAPNVHLMDAYNCTSLHSEVDELPGGVNVKFKCRIPCKVEMSLYSF